MQILVDYDNLRCHFSKIKNIFLLEICCSNNAGCVCRGFGAAIPPSQECRNLAAVIIGIGLMKMFRWIYRSALGLALACALPTMAQAAVVYDAIVVKDAVGTVLAAVKATAEEIAADPNAVFYVPGIAVDPAEYGNFGVVIENGDPFELFGIADGGPDGHDLAFGLQGVAASYFIQNPVDGTGLPIDMTLYLAPILREAGVTASFIVSVPEPLTWAMMVVGFAAIGGAMRRKAKAAPQALTYS